MFLIARYNLDGGFDTSFGAGGWRTFSVPNLSEGWVHRVLIQPDGKIVMVGHSGPYRALLMRCEANGTLDTSFNGTGIVETQLDGQVSDFIDIADAKLQLDGKVVVCAGRYHYSGAHRFGALHIHWRAGYHV